MRLATFVILLGVQAGPVGADVQRPAPPLKPGTYQGPGYVTNFDREGRWSTLSGTTEVTGRYSIDNGVMFFTTEPAGCEQERVRYRFTPTSDGFRLVFLEDTCGRSHQDEVVFVRLRAK